MTYYFDIDNTITKTPMLGDEPTAGLLAYKSAEPIPERIAKINELYDAGHKIVYWTGRGTVSGIHYGELTEMQLKEWGAKYHELLRGKPDFDIMVDDKAVNSEAFFKPKRIGLVLNNLIRDYIGKLTEFYEKYTKQEPILPIDPYNLELSFPLSNEEFTDVYQWLYYGISLEVFGGANQTCTNLLSRLSNFQTKINDKLIILSRETSRTKFATLSFLAKCQMDLGEVIFVDSYSDYWNYVDVLITDNPAILKEKPKNKIAVVLRNNYNTEFDGDYVIQSAEEIFNLPFIDRKPVKPEELIHVTGEMMPEDEFIMDNPEELVIEGAKAVTADEAKIEFIDGKPVVVDLTEIRENINENESIRSDNDE